MNYFPKKKKTNQPLMKKEIFIKLFKLATQGQFLYMDVLYKKIDDLTFDRITTWTNNYKFFLANLENRILKNKNQRCPKLYLRYVDAVFAVF